MHKTKSNTIIKNIDLNELEFYKKYPKLLDLLLFDQTTKKFLVWGTNLYKKNSSNYKQNKQMKPELVIVNGGKVIRPRILKSKIEQQKRSKEMAEVFTPAWICNYQNNVIDDAWFKRKNVFNIANGQTWKTNNKKIIFNNSNWESYVLENRLEITCGEAPYITSRYDVTSSSYIPIQNRIGFLDRKIRVINENVKDNNNWYHWVKKAYQHTYGYDFQGDNVLLARENLLLTFIDNFFAKFNYEPPIEFLLEIAEIISWNIWQMDGLKMVVPYSCCKKRKKIKTFFGEKIEIIDCEGCSKKDINKNHNGIYCYIFDWEEKKKIRFVDLYNGGLSGK